MNYADLACDRRGLLGIFILAATVASGFGIARLEFDEEPRAVFKGAGIDSVRLDRLFAEFGPDDAEVLVTVECDDLFAPRALDDFERLVRQLRAAPGVESVESFLQARNPTLPAAPLLPSDRTIEQLAQARERALSHPVLAGQFLSADGKVTFALVRLTPDSGALSTVAPRIAGLRAATADLPADSPLRVGLAGHPAARVDMVEISRAEIFRYMALSALITGVVALIAFRRPAAVVIALAGPALGTLWTLGTLGWMGEKLNGLNTCLPSLVFVIAFGDSVHVVIEFMQERAAGGSRRGALKQTLHTVGPACFLMVFTTVVGFGSLAIAELDGIRRFGIDAAVGTVVGFVAVLTVLPWLMGTALGDAVTSRTMHHGPHGHHGGISGPIVALTHRLLRYPRTTAAVSIVVTAVLTLLSCELRSDIRWMEMLPAESETARITQLCDDSIGGSLLAYVVVEWPEDLNQRSPPVAAALRDVHRLIDDAPPLRGPFSVLNIAAGLTRNGSVETATVQAAERTPPHLLRRLLRGDLRRTAVTAHVPDIGAAALIPIFADVDRRLGELAKRHPGFTFELTGTAVVAARNVYQIIDDAARSLVLSAVVIVATMMIAFRSVRLGLICLVPTLFPLAVTASGLVLLGEPLRLAGAMTFSICLGLADDNTIHFVSRFRHGLARGHDVGRATSEALIVCGKSMIVMCATLAAGLLPMALGRIPPIATFGKLTIAALAASLVGDLVILPALLTLFAKQPAQAERPSPS